MGHAGSLVPFCALCKSCLLIHLLKMLIFIIFVILSPHDQRLNGRCRAHLRGCPQGCTSILWEAVLTPSFNILSYYIYICIHTHIWHRAALFLFSFLLSLSLPHSTICIYIYICTHVSLVFVSICAAGRTVREGQRLASIYKQISTQLKFGLMSACSGVLD